MATMDNLLSAVIQRRAINSSGRLGSLYNGCRDSVMGLTNESLPGQRLESSESVRCELMNGSMHVNYKALQIIGVDDPLRLSLLLQTTHRIGIAAILNHPHRIDEHNRLLCYSWTHREEQVSDGIISDLKLNESIQPTTSATHMITGISYGIDMIVILQMPANIDMPPIDRVLQKINTALSNGHDTVSLLTSKEINLLTKDIEITVYSNMAVLTGLKNTSTLLQQLNTIKKKPTQCPPIVYNLRSFASLYPRYTGTNIFFQTLSAELNDTMEQNVLRKRTTMTNLMLTSLDSILQSSSKYYNGRLYGLHQQYSRVNRKYLAEMKRLSELVIGLRSGTVNIAIIKDVLTENEEILVNNGIDELAQDLQHLVGKAHLIRQLQEKEFHYCNATDRDINKRDDERTVEMKLIRNDQDVRFLCSNDALNRASPLQLNKLQSDLIEEHQHNATLRLFYADFSYCLYQLPHMTILPLNANLKPRHVWRMKTPSALTQLQPPVPPHGGVKMTRSTSDTVHDSIPPLPLPMNDTINILLLGETGVGKSTFINAFVNYLTFSSLQQAQASEPIVIIPVSFIMTTGEHFIEHDIKFGECDSANNEDFDHLGQSVTQHCKSYIFTLNRHNGKKLRIIDTPGFGDTRGLDQDDLNMQHILQYINNLSHLNAICFLLKPNASRLNMFFRTCLTQLFSLLAPTAHHNVIFCFTNARSTFYTPGDTAPLLKTMLNSLSMGDIPFRKENTFCFDSESFRYLVALQNEIEFSDEDKREYATSWSTSVKESNRLIDHIDGNLVRYDVRNGMQSMKHAEFEITHMIRPMLETMRNTLRNLILHRMHWSDVSIKLYPKPVLHPVAICFRCERQSVQVAHFRITLDQPHEFYKKCCTCSCGTTDHKMIGYVLEYKTRNNSSTYQINEMNDILHRLSNASAEFSYFLMYGARCTEDDQFITGLMRMIDEEENICHEKGSYPMNLQLIEELKQVYHEYQQRINELGANQDHKTLQTIYQHIETISNYSEMREQMIAVKQSHNAIMKEHEVVV